MGLIDDLKKKLRRRASPEAQYLDEATSPVDLEMRLREIDRGRFSRNGRMY